MGVKLDWQVESDKVHRQVGESRQDRRRRRRKRLQVFLLTIVMLIAATGVVAVAMQRINAYDRQLEQNLIDVAKSETLALRLGDYAGFINLQRSSSPDWIRAQNLRFERYQQDKLVSGLQLDGRVLNVEIDGQRGRVVLEEMLDGHPYRTVWYYWRYRDGWYHVPDDFTFWGDDATIKGAITTVEYRTLDAPLAEALAPIVEAIWSAGCSTERSPNDARLIQNCENHPNLTVRIVSQPGAALGWIEDQPYTLIVPSPLMQTGRERIDQPLAPETQSAIERLLVGRLAER